MARRDRSSDGKSASARAGVKARETVTCPLCGTRLSRHEEPHESEVGADLRAPTARHRCVPRVPS